MTSDPKADEIAHLKALLAEQKLTNKRLKKIDDRSNFSIVRVLCLLAVIVIIICLVL